MDIKQIQPRFHGPRKSGVGINTLVIHYTCAKWARDPEIAKNKYSIDSVVAVLNQERLSYHYVIDRDGVCYQLTPDRRRAYHAGISVLHGDTDLNHCSIGISLIGEGGVEFTTSQFDTLVELVVELRGLYKIPLNRVVGHDQVGWNRKHPKVDPGPLFPWLEFLDRVGSYRVGE